MSTSGFQAMPGWYRPDDIPKQENQSTYGPDPRHSSPHSTQGDNQARNGEPSRPRQKYWPPRQCRICLETVQPTYHPPFTNLPGILQFTSSVTYESEEGRLLRPCKCKGSSKYVHEGCLQSWRHADPAYGRRNYWQCPTCGFRYRLARLGWGHVVSSPGKFCT
jgi:RING-variant domain